MGFSLTLGPWLRTELQDIASDLLLSPGAAERGYFVPTAIRTMWDDHQRGARNHVHHLWALMMLEMWHRLFLDGTPGEDRMAAGSPTCPYDLTLRL